MINWSLITPRNIAVIGLMAIAAHIVVKPLYQLVNGSKG